MHISFIHTQYFRMKISWQSPRDSKIVLAQLHENQLRVDWEIGEETDGGYTACLVKHLQR